jgi:hypothetical protein
MRGQHQAHWAIASGVVIGVVLGAISAHARQTSETLTADASVKSAAGVQATAPVVVAIKRYASDAERDALLAALKQGGTAAARQVLAKREDAGSVQIGGKQTPIKYAYARSTGSGRLITVVTAEPIVFIGAGLPDAKPKAGSAPGHRRRGAGTGRAGAGDENPRQRRGRHCDRGLQRRGGQSLECNATVGIRCPRGGCSIRSNARSKFSSA